MPDAAFPDQLTREIALEKLCTPHLSVSISDGTDWLWFFHFPSDWMARCGNGRLELWMGWWSVEVVGLAVFTMSHERGIVGSSMWVSLADCKNHARTWLLFVRSFPPTDDAYSTTVAALGRATLVHL